MIFLALIKGVSLFSFPINEHNYETASSIKYFVFHSGLAFIFVINTTSITVIVFYLSELTCERIDKVIHQVKGHLDTNNLFSKMMAIKQNIITMNQSVSFGLFVKLFESGLIMSSLGCLLALILQQDHLKSIQNFARVIGTSTMLTYELIECAIIFNSNRNLIEKCNELKQQIEMQMNYRKCSPELCNQVMVTLKLVEGINLNAFFFDIKNSTFLTLLGHIVSFIVILIQTEI